MSTEEATTKSDQQQRGGGLHRSTEAREAYKKSLQESKGDSKAGDLLEFWSERKKAEKLVHEPPKYLKDVCSKLQSPTVSSMVGTRPKFTPNTSSTNNTPNLSRSRSTTPARVFPDNMTTVVDDSVDDVDGIWQSVHSDSDDTPFDTTMATATKRPNNNKYANTPSKLYQPTAASLHGQFKRETPMASNASPSTMTTMSSTEHKDEIPPHVNLKYAHVTSKLLAPTAATIAARKVTNPLDLLLTHHIHILYFNAFCQLTATNPSYGPTLFPTISPSGASRTSMIHRPWTNTINQYSVGHAKVVIQTLRTMISLVMVVAMDVTSTMITMTMVAPCGVTWVDSMPTSLHDCIAPPLAPCKGGGTWTRRGLEPCPSKWNSNAPSTALRTHPP